MNKLEIQQRVLQYGKPLSLDKFNWDEETKTFSTTENDLVLDFTAINGNCTFDTAWECTFKTGKDCVIVRRDIFEIIQPEEGQEIKLNECEEKGFTIIDTGSIKF